MSLPLYIKNKNYPIITNNKEDPEFHLKVLKYWITEMSKKDHIQIAYVGTYITSPLTGHHFHLLMFGKNKKGETLLCKDKIKWQEAWHDLTKKSAVIKYVENDRIANYLSLSKNTPIDNSELLSPYNEKLLLKYQKK